MKDFEKFLKNKKIEYFEEISSTNTILKERAVKGEPENTIIVAEYQTAGRGRLGKTFFSPRGCGVYLSYLIKPDIQAQDAVYITVAAAVAMVRALNKVLGIKTQVKWVNDIYYCDKKLCGILRILPRKNNNLDLGISILYGNKRHSIAVFSYLCLFRVDYTCDRDLRSVSVSTIRYSIIRKG